MDDNDDGDDLVRFRGFKQTMTDNLDGNARDEPPVNNNLKFQQREMF